MAACLLVSMSQRPLPACLTHVKASPCVRGYSEIVPMSALMAILRRNRKGVAATCLVIWLSAFAIGVAAGCALLPAAHAFEMSHSPASHSGADNGDNDVGCGTSCADGLPLPAQPASVHGFFTAHVFIVQTWTDTLLPSVVVRAEAANHGGPFHSGVPPRLRYHRLTL